jgi:hypothetical protein
MFAIVRVVLHRGRWGAKGERLPWRRPPEQQLESFDCRLGRDAMFWMPRDTAIAELVTEFSSLDAAEFHLRKLELVEPLKEFRVCRHHGMRRAAARQPATGQA